MTKIGKILTKNFDFRGHLATFGAVNTSKIGHFKSKTMPKYFLNNSWTNLKKSPKPLFWFQNGQNSPSQITKIGKNLTNIFYFRGHLSTFRAENTQKIGHFKSKKMRKYFLNKSRTTLKKSRKWLFRPPKMVKIEVSKWSNFDKKFRFSRSIINLSSWKYTQKWAF